MREKILSVGIDIGTSTMVIVFSHVHVENVASFYRIPDAKIVQKEVIYRSPVYFTPLLSNTQLDMDGITRIVHDEYRSAGIKPSEVQTGAVIITGDTARKSNAESVLHSISRYAGDFVVATAGPNLEGILAGKGSGAEQYSLDTIETITNLDIGGGTTNIAAFHGGSVVDVECLDVGGRLIRFSPNTLEIEYIFPKTQELAEELGLSLQLGTRMDHQQIRRIARAMAEVILERFGNKPRSKRYHRLRTNDDQVIMQVLTDAVSFSGGVGDLIFMPQLPADYEFNDIGVVLAKEIIELVQDSGLKVVKPAETIGATVVGAGSHSVEISGSTVLITSKNSLPIQNIPILKIDHAEEMTSEMFSNAIRQNIKWIQGYDDTQNVALAINCSRDIGFTGIGELADKVLGGMSDLLDKQDLLIVVMKNDFGKVFGQSLRAKLAGKINVICLDGINVQNGDYLDIGKPIGIGDALPVVIKTLVFSH